MRDFRFDPAAAAAALLRLFNVHFLPLKTLNSSKFKLFGRAEKIIISTIPSRFTFYHVLSNFRSIFFG
jgi:hypothetical protein